MSSDGISAPEWMVEDVIGLGEGSLAAYKGKPLLILFWSIGCAGCTGRAIPYTLELQERYPDLQIVAFHSEFEHAKKHTPADVRAVADYFRLPYPVLIDESLTTFDAYEAMGTPHWVLVEADGTIRRSIFGSLPGSIQRLDYALMELFEVEID